MDTNYIFTYRELFKDKLQNYDEIMQICEMVAVKDKKKKKKTERIKTVWQEDDPLTKSLNFIFNKLSVNNVDIIYNETSRLLKLMINYPKHIEYVIHSIFLRGMKNEFSINLYVLLFKRLNKEHDIHKILISISEYLFYSNFHDSNNLSKICDFVSYMYKETLLSKETIIYCLDMLLTHEKYFEFCQLLEKNIIEFYDLYKVKLDALFIDHSVSNKVKFKINDIYDLI